MSPGPGWYPDPIGDHPERWWDGHHWSEHVRFGPFTTVSPPAAVAVPGEEAVLRREPSFTLTTHAAYLGTGASPLVVPWWSVANVEVRVGIPRAISGRADVVLIIDYPGYTDRRERRLNNLVDPHAVAALCFAWSRRHRRAAGYL